MYYDQNSVSPGVSALVDQIRGGRAGGAGDRGAMIGQAHTGGLDGLGLRGPVAVDPRAGQGPMRGYAATGGERLTPEMQRAAAMAKPALAGAPQMRVSSGMPGQGATMAAAPGQVRPQMDRMPPTLRARMMALQGGGGQAVR